VAFVADVWLARVVGDTANLDAGSSIGDSYHLLFKHDHYVLFRSLRFDLDALSFSYTTATDFASAQLWTHHFLSFFSYASHKHTLCCQAARPYLHAPYSVLLLLLSFLASLTILHKLSLQSFGAF
jgi:hypothetical protein